MALVASSVAGLGDGIADGQVGYVDLGIDHDRVELHWHQASGAWIGEALPSFTLRDGWIMTVNDFAAPLELKYFSDTSGNPGQVGQNAFGWNPLAIRHADAAFAAGLTLQENLLADFWSWDAGRIYRLATVWYPFNDGESISNTTVDPSAHVGVTIDSVPTRRVLSGTGWLDSGVQASSKHNLLPHLYGEYVTTKALNNSVEYLLALRRWVGAP